jgi:hypothetical protein
MEKNDEKKQWVEGVIGFIRLFSGLGLNLGGLSFINEWLSCCRQGISNCGDIKYVLDWFEPLSVLQSVLILTKAESFPAFNK